MRARTTGSLAHRPARARFWGGVALAGLGVLATAPAAAQITPPPVDQGEEHELPDINAIERGAKPRASVSFAKPVTPPTPPAPAAPGTAETAAAPGGPPGAVSVPLSATGGGGGDNVRRLTAPPPPSFIRRSGIYGLDSSAPLSDGMMPGDGEQRAEGDLPGDHVIKDGETMTSVCEQYFADPQCWPRLWASNPQVSNPHWVFPGDVIHLRGHRGGARAGAAPAKPPAGARLVSNRRGFVDNRGVVLREAGFIDKQALTESGKVTGSREEKIMLASGDQAYVGFPKDKPLKAGERYTVFVADIDTPVKSPDSREVLGYIVRVYGEILIDQVTDGNVARGTLSDLAGPVERGFSVSPRVRLFKQLEPKPAAANLEARVVASFSPNLMLASENFVVLSRGAKDGLQVGNRIFVVRRGDGYRPIMEGWAAPDPNFPKEMVAELWVVDVRNKAAVAWVARSSKELRVGEVAELRKGH